MKIAITGVLMLNEDIPIGSIAKMMGHADITSTQVYAAAYLQANQVGYAENPV